VIGRAVGHGAATIVSAVATGRGAAFGIDLPVTVTYRIEGEGLEVTTSRGLSPRLVECCLALLRERRGIAGGARVTVESSIPPSRGLKSSSAVANTVLRAAARAHGVPLPDREVLDLSVDAAIAAGVTITGAFDDAAACLLGGVAVTDNRSRTILRTAFLPADLVAVVHIPRRETPKARVARLDFSGIAGDVQAAVELALRGDYPAAMNANGAAYARVLDVDPEVADRARRSGAVAASVSGTGPATVALGPRRRATEIARALGDGEAEVRVVGLVPPLEVTA